MSKSTLALSIASLSAMGAFTGAPVEKTITWTKGEDTHEALVYVRPLSYRSTVSDLREGRENGDAVAGRIAASICDAEGVPVFTVGDITGDADPERGPLDGNLTMALLVVIGEVNGLGKTTR